MIPTWMIVIIGLHVGLGAGCYAILCGSEFMLAFMIGILAGLIAIIGLFWVSRPRNKRIRKRGVIGLFSGME